VRPIVSSIEIRDNTFFFDVKGTANADTSGAFKFDDLKSGTYQVWVQLTQGTEMVSGCTDVTPSDDKWDIWAFYTTVTNNGLEYRTQGPTSLGRGTGLQQIQTEYLKLAKPEYTLTGFYAILKDFTMEPSVVNKLDITLVCK
jgi:hypothetical protein